MLGLLDLPLDRRARGGENTVFTSRRASVRFFGIVMAASSSDASDDEGCVLESSLSVLATVVPTSGRCFPDRVLNGVIVGGLTAVLLTLVILRAGFAGASCDVTRDAAESTDFVFVVRAGARFEVGALSSSSACTFVLDLDDGTAARGTLPVDQSSDSSDRGTCGLSIACNRAYGISFANPNGRVRDAATNF